jgi:cobalt-zinc-cadmium efflux system membrane fusion protein
MMSEQLALSESEQQHAAAPEPRRGRRIAMMGVGGVVAIGVAALLVAGQRADGDATPTVQPAPQRDVPELRDGAIVFSAQFAERADVRDAEVEIRDVVPVVRATGTVTFDPRRMAVVGSRIAARVGSVAVVPGQRVKKGDLLAKLEAAELAHVQAELEVLRARLVTAEAEAQRKRRLAQEGIAAERAAQIAETDLRALQIERDAGRERIRALGGRPRKSRLGRLELHAPIAGEVVEVGIAQGQPLDPNVVAIRIADLSTVWVELAVFERDLDEIHTGDEVTLALRSRPDQRVRGKVDHVGVVLDPHTRSAPVRVVVDNTERALAIGESVVGDIRARGQAVHAPAVPRDAVVMVDGQPTVFVVVAPGTVEPRKIDIAAEGESWVAMHDGLAAGERVVVSGVFALKSELFR